jgi:hypothetical protein
MKPTDIIEQIKKTNPGVLRGVDDKAAARLLHLVFARIAQQVSEAEDGVVAVPGLGRFRVTTLSITKDGVAADRKRIVFAPWIANKDGAIIEPKQPAAM